MTADTLPKNPPIAQTACPWRSMTTAEVAASWEETFRQHASILPNAEVLEALREQCPSESSSLPLALVAVNDTWSVYVAGMRFLAVNVYDGETLAVTSLPPNTIEQLQIPLPSAA